MSTKINLLPDVRLTKLRDQRNRRLAVTAMTGSILVVAGLLIVGFLVVQGQYITINSLTSAISNRKHQVASYPNVKPMLSTQARLAQLPQLYAQRAIMTQAYQTLASIEPSDVAFTNISFDASNQLTISAEGHSYLAAARLARALEQSNLTVGNGASTSNQPYFSNVNLSAVTLSGGITAFTITAKANPGVNHAGK